MHAAPPSPCAAALQRGDIDGAAKMIADATASGNSLAVNTAATLAPPAGVTPQLAQAASLAVTKYGANATTVAGALSQVRCDCTVCGPVFGDASGAARHRRQGGRQTRWHATWHARQAQASA